MKIITPGNMELLKKTKRFKCNNCECVFEADKDEYEYGGSQHNESHYNESYYQCKCPCCGKIVWDVK